MNPILRILSEHLFGVRKELTQLTYFKSQQIPQTLKIPEE